MSSCVLCVEKLNKKYLKKNVYNVMFGLHFLHISKNTGIILI